MLSFILIQFVCPATLLLICLYLHFRNHFEIKIKRNKKLLINNNSRRHSHNNASSNIHLNIKLQRTNHSSHVSQASHLSEISTFTSSYKIRRTKHFCKQLKHYLNIFTFIRSKDSDWNFFPVSFLFYILFLLILTLIIISKYHKYTYSIINKSCPNQFNNNISDWITVYCVTILNLWESLLNFYRYWTTRECSLLRIGDTMTLYLYYCIYLFIFLILCILQFHFVYWLFPLVIIAHCAYNLFCVAQFTRILIKQYNAFSNPDRKALAIVNDNMLSSVKIMGYVSFVSFTLNTIFLSLIVWCYNVHIMCYLPLIYSLSSFAFAFNFVRNRVSLTHFLRKLQQIPMKLRKLKSKICTKESDNKNVNVNNEDCIISDEENQSPHIQTPTANHLTLDMPITSAPSASLNEELDTNLNKTMHMHAHTNDTDAIEIENTKLTLAVPPIRAKNCKDDMILSNAKTSANHKRAQSNRNVNASLTPLLTSSNHKQRFIDTYRNQSRSEPSSPLIHNIRIQNANHKKHKQQIPKTPQTKGKFSQSPVLNWVKSLSLKAALKTKSADQDNNYTEVTLAGKHKRNCKSEGLPQFSQLVTHSTSFEEELRNDTCNDNTSAVLSVFGEKAVSPSKKSKSKKAWDILGIDGSDHEEMQLQIKNEEIAFEITDDKGEFVYLDDELPTDQLRMIDDDFSLSVHESQIMKNIINTSHNNENSNENNKNNQELFSYEKWNAFDKIYDNPSKELRLQQSTSEQQVELHCMGSKRNSKISQSHNRRSSLNREDMLKAMDLEKASDLQRNISDIKEEENSNEIQENEVQMNNHENIENKYEFHDMAAEHQHRLGHVGHLGKKRKSTKDDEIVAMLQLMVQHGFYSKKTLNSVEQLRKYNKQ